MANINLNVSPYFDDYDPDKDFLRVLYRDLYETEAHFLEKNLIYVPVLLFQEMYQKSVYS